MPPTNRNWVVVAGAGGSLGSGCVAHYATIGPVLALDISPAEVVHPANVVSVALDLTSPAEVDAALENIPRGEAISLLVNAVGLIWNEPALSFGGKTMVMHDVATFRRVVDANLTAAFVAATRTAARMVRSGGGAIVNFSSFSASGVAGQSAYAAAKAGVAGLTKALAAELGPLGVRVNALAPGFIDVQSTRAALSDAKIKEYASRTPLRRMGTLSELIEAVHFLSAASYVNGAVLDIDGGLKH